MTRDEAVAVLAAVVNAWQGTIANGRVVEEAFHVLTAEHVPAHANGHDDTEREP